MLSLLHSYHKYMYFQTNISEQKPEESEQAEKEDGSDDLDFEDAREGGNDEETPEGLTLVEPTENSSFYIVQELEGQETPPGTT